MCNVEGLSSEHSVHGSFHGHCAVRPHLGMGRERREGKGGEGGEGGREGERGWSRAAYV